MATIFDSQLFGHLFTSDEVRSLFSEAQLVSGWLLAEAALAEAQAQVGIIPEEAAVRIRQEAKVENFDFEAMREGIVATGHPIVPMIRQLVEICGEHGRWVHWGATTQDIMDTGLVLQLRAAMKPILADLDRAVHSVSALAQDHAQTVMAGRTHAQHAVPISFGHKLAVWADELLRSRQRLVEAARSAEVGQLAGAAGTLATLPETGSDVRRRYCAILGLADPVVPWHTSRDRLRDLMFAFDHVAAAAERISAEIVRMQATELAEIAEPAAPKHVGSSTMPQKRNPFTSEVTYASAKILHSLVGSMMSNTTHAFERDMMSWAGEWFTIPSIVMLASGITEKLAFVVSDLFVDPARMRRNLAMTEPAIMAESLMMALAKDIGHENAHTLLHDAIEEAGPDGDLVQILKQKCNEKGYDVEWIDAAADPTNYRGLADEAIEFVVTNAGRI